MAKTKWERREEFKRQEIKRYQRELGMTRYQAGRHFENDHSFAADMRRLVKGS